MTRALVTGVGGRSVGHQILQALAFSGNDYSEIATDADAFSFGLYLDIVEQRQLVPFATSPDYRDTILDLVRRTEPEVLLPGTEAEIRVLTGMREQLAALGCHLVASPAEGVALCNDKGALYRWLAEEGIGVPVSAGVDGWQDLAARVGYPLVGKPAGLSGGSRDVAILADEAEIERYIETFPGPRSDIVFQEYVGDATSEYTVGVVVSAAGEAIDSIVLHRVLTGLSLGPGRTIDGRRYTLSTGYSQGIIVDDPEVRRFCEDLAVKMKLTGPVNIQLRKHDDGTIKVFEVHPRFSGTSSIRAQAGFNEPDMVIADQLRGEKVGRQSYRTDVAAIRAFQSILVPVADLDALRGG
jgi:carbamoyl-phosphate synthase large subunit